MKSALLRHRKISRMAFLASFVLFIFTFAALSFASSAHAVQVAAGGAHTVALKSDDTVGTWSGFEVKLDDNFNLVDTYTSNATVLQNLTFTVNNKYGTTTGTIFSSGGPVVGFGVNVTLPGNIAGEGAILMSADKSFAGGGVCPNKPTTLSDCSFSAWKKQ